MDNCIAWKQQNIGTVINAMNILIHVSILGTHLFGTYLRVTLLVIGVNTFRFVR